MSRTSPRLGREALLRQRQCRRRSKANRTDRRFPLRNQRNKAHRRNPTLRNPSRGNPPRNNSPPCRSTLFRDPPLRNLPLRNLLLRNLLLRNLLLRRSPSRNPRLRNVPRGSHPRRCRRPGNAPCKRPRTWTLFRKNPSLIIMLPRHLRRSSPPGRIRSRWTRLRWGLRRQRPRHAAFRSGGRGRPFTTRAACTAAAAPGTRSSRRSGVPPLR